ncbi:MAG: tRNA glutamyl-Q(34) synthetase GluQRS, partial [Gammaproteobacteria bacterium]
MPRSPRAPRASREAVRRPRRPLPLITPRYIGRFAPSPTGPLHQGSLLAALGSFLDAHHAGGDWLLRLDDLDQPRCRTEHAASILDALAAHGLNASRPATRQTDDPRPYAAALAALEARGLLFACDCSRREFAAAGLTEPCCLRDCRTRRPPASGSALRVDLSALHPMTREDSSLGTIRFDPAQHRDLVVRRRDGIVAYALAVVVDDADAGVTDVVRGGDLREGTGWQLALHQALALEPPRYLHLPVVVEPDGTKLAKSRRSVPLDAGAAARNLVQVLGWLRQPVPAELRAGD